jgi:deoxyribodipyrimidine photo-lyase
LWFRNDLRVHDNGALHKAIELTKLHEKSELVPVFVFDTRIYQDYTSYDTRKTGAVRAMFNIESVKILRKNLEIIGSSLLVFSGKTEEIMAEMCLKKDGCETRVVVMGESGPGDRRMENLVQKTIQEIDESNDIVKTWGGCLFEKEDLNFDPEDEVVTRFNLFRDDHRSKKVKKCLEVPESLPEV